MEPKEATTLNVVIPALVAGIQLSANFGASREMDSGHEGRNDAIFPVLFDLNRKDSRKLQTEILPRSAPPLHGAANAARQTARGG
jgi:hypothetical protein